ncbi:MAG: YraN family protein [Phycisphaerae bacterium]|jgi:putative endonuclease|nr:YraN family protein [Phycisphaerae bacterium]
MWPFGPAKSLGQRGELLAARMLKRKGMKILARNYRCPPGEIDIIALDRGSRRDSGRETIVFVEVKTRSDDSYNTPESAVDARKRRRIRKAARYYLSHYPTRQYAVRYDIVAVLAPNGSKPQIKHITAAFSSSPDPEGL